MTWDPMRPTTPQGPTWPGRLPVDGILRVGDLLWYDGVDVALLLEAPDERRDPWRARYVPIDDSDVETFEAPLPADFGERMAREGHLAAADAWSAWTEGPCS